MAYSSTSSPTRARNYDVFLSFRGKDTRDNFVSYLHKALVDEGIRTFIDDRELEEGDNISERLVNAIQTSWFAVVVLSENYATSNWCLEELRQIMELSSKKHITVVPIFYKVKPADVRYQNESFKTAFEKKRYTDPERILKWRGALAQVGDLSGKHPKEGVNEATMVAKIVSSISTRLENMKPLHLIKPVGREANLEKMEVFLNKEPKSEVRMMGILGMGGIGKTTIARYLYNQFSHEFSFHCFIKDAWKIRNPDQLQRELLSHIRNEGSTKLPSREASDRKIKDILGHKKVFLVIDGVDDADQVLALAKERSWFGHGSRIIITTRDRGLLNSCRVDDIHEVNCLDEKDALHVFRKLAFGGRSPPFHGSEKLFIRASRLAHGLPSALVAFALHLSEQTTITRWEDELSLLEASPHEKVQDILRASYDGLDQYDKNVFLQVACLFNGGFAWLIKAFLGKSGSRIHRLVEKSLLDISNDGRLIMHFLVEQTGKQIVRQESKLTPCNQKFLWEPEEIYDVLSRNIGTNVIEGVSLHTCDMSDTLNISSSVFKPMNNLTFLNLLKHVVDTESKLQLISDVSVSDDTTHGLKLLHWDAYPLEALPLSFRSSILVDINLRYSNLKHLWDEPNVYKSVVYKPKLFTNLRRLDVTGSTNLVELPDLSQSLKLEELIMEGCKSLKQTPGSIDRLHLRKLNIVRCDSLTGRMEVGYLINEPEDSFHRRIELFLLDQVATLSSLTDLSIQGKITVALLHTLTGTAERLSFTSQQEIPEQLIITLEDKTGAIQFLHLLKTLVIERLEYLEIDASFSCHSFSNFPCLTELKLINLNIRELPEDIDCLLSLRTIDLTGNDFMHLPKTMTHLTKLESLTLRNCRNLEALPQRTHQLDNQAKGLLELCIDNCKNLQSLEDQLLCNYYKSLSYLDISNHEFERMPTSISKLSSLTTLYVNNCKKLKSVEELPQSVNHLYAQGCDSLESVSLSPDFMIKQIDLRDCPRLTPDERSKLLSSKDRHGRPVSVRFSVLSKL